VVIYGQARFKIMFQAILECGWEFLVDWVLGFFWWLILYPVVLIVSLPFVLILAAFCRQPYWRAVGNMLATVNDFWRETALSWAVE